MRTTNSNALVQSRANGLVIAVPPDARGVVGRFNTQGGNELIFTQTKATVDDATLVVEGAREPGQRRPKAPAKKTSRELA